MKISSGGAAAAPVFEAGGKRHPVVRLLENLIAVFCTLVMWLFLILTLYNKLYVNANPQEGRVLLTICLAFGAAFLLLGLWQLYNWLRFHKKARRKEFPHQSLAEVGKLYGISGENMERLQEIRKVAVVEFKNHRYYYCIQGQEPIEIGMLRKT